MNIKTLSILFSIEYLLPNQNIFLVNFIKNLYKKKLHLSSVLITNNSILKIDYALQMVCDEYNITRFTLIHTKDRGEIQDAKRIAYCLLHFDIGLTEVEYIKNAFEEIGMKK